MSEEPIYGEELDLLATVTRLAARLPEGEVTSEEDYRLAVEMLSDASQEAWTYGNPNWTPENVPPGVVNLVLRAAVRGYMNPSGYLRERADSVSLERGEDYVRGAEFTKAERDQVKALAEKRGVTYSRSTRQDIFISRSDNPQDRTLYVPVAGGHNNWRRLPWLAEQEVGWLKE